MRAVFDLKDFGAMALVVIFTLVAARHWLNKKRSDQPEGSVPPAKVPSVSHLGGRVLGVGSEYLFLMLLG
ncbi:hypothetical protein QQS21_005680 [Conoideocrella luteorostrata]|uniref:Uncharacterized protein n=1 Tax=Conoideocrella luteorostrata TaxID=1105319 RepID=A0AAJ0CP60_9HYPO|nr:hypothetical protein QQS21_005680 [Conoideocrella luteorostrata]